MIVLLNNLILIILEFNKSCVKERERLYVPGRRLTSQLSCFLEMLVQERPSVTGCLFMMPVRA